MKVQTSRWTAPWWSWGGIRRATHVSIRLRVSRHHCCMRQENGEVTVRDLGSTNGIRINGQRVESGRLRPGDELSIAHIRYRLENGQGHEQTIAEPAGVSRGPARRGRRAGRPCRGGLGPAGRRPSRSANGGENAFAAAVRKLLPNGVADKCRIQVIVQMAGDNGPGEEEPAPSVAEPCLGERRRMSFRLVPLVKGTAPLIALYRPVLLIGRHLECDVRIDSPKISRRHCCLAMAYDRVLIRDLGSRNGVRVNGRLVEEARLQAGDELAIGPILFRLELESEHAANAPATPSCAERPSRPPGDRPPLAPSVKSPAPTPQSSATGLGYRPGSPRRRLTERQRCGASLDTQGIRDHVRRTSQNQSIHRLDSYALR